MIRTLLLLTLLSQLLFAKAQEKYVVTGLVKDSTGQALIGANIWLMTNIDTLHTISNEQGIFTFNQAPSLAFSIRISIMGYESFVMNYPSTPSHGSIQLPDIILRIKSNLLKEIIVKSQLSPVTLKEDTIEYSINNYHLKNNALIEDLLRRLPGIEVDKNGAIKFMGQAINRLKINGKEFEIGNVQDLLRLIPLEYLDKVQIIDDKNKMAELTGRSGSIGNKIINLETKKNLDTNDRLLLITSGGTLGRYNNEINASSISEKKQILLNGKLDNTYAESGETVNKKAIFVYRNQLNDKLYTTGGVFIDGKTNDKQTNSTFETITSAANLFGNGNNSNNNSIQNYTISEALNFTDNKKNTLNFQVSGVQSNQSETNKIQSIQTGLQHIDQTSNITNTTHSPKISTSLYGLHQFKNPAELLALGINYDHLNSTSYQYSINHSLYYNTDNTIDKDSLLYQEQNKTIRNRVILVQASYVKPFSTKTSLEVKYNINSNRYSNDLETQWANSEGKMIKIDSLSTGFNYNKTEHLTGINLKHIGNTLEFTAGLELFYAFYFVNQSKWLIPEMNIIYKINKWSRLTLHYEGHPSYPEYQQLNSVPDRGNPLYPIIGNPSLNAGLYHLYFLDYRYTGKSILFVTLYVNPLSNQVVTNTILNKDISNTFTQETHFINTNGVYTYSGNYAWSRPFNEWKYQLFIQGNGNYNNNIYYLDGLRNTALSMMLSQSIRGGIYQKWVELNLGVGYAVNHTSYSNSQAAPTTINSWNLNINTKLFVSQSWSFWIDLKKQFNSGYRNDINTNPTNLNATIEKTFLKNKLTFRLQGFNLLDQNTGITQTISGNTTTQTRTNQLGRFILFSAILDLKKTKK